MEDDNKIEDSMNQEPPCAEKLAFDTRQEAEHAVTVTKWQYGSLVKVYQCDYCHLWHLSSN